MTASPQISVVIASIVGAPFIDKCVKSLERQAAAAGAEVIVVASGSEAYAERIRKGFPWVRVIHRAERDSVPELRRQGVEAAAGSVIAVIEEHCTAAEDWLEIAHRALASGHYGATGGPVCDADYDRLRDWAVYFCEYNGSLPPAPAGETAELNGANIAYRRDVLMKYGHLLGRGYWEAALHPVLLADGIRFVSAPEMRVFHQGPFDFGYYLRQRYWFSRAFAGARAGSLPASKRLAYLAAAPMIPALLLTRMALRVWRKRCHVDKFAASLPLFVPALTAFVAGEWVGYVAGPGEALSKVE